MKKGGNDHWYASISKNYFITAFIKDEWVNTKFESRILMLCFHFWSLLFSGALPVLVASSIFSFGIPLSLFSSSCFWISSWVKLSPLPGCYNRVEEVCIRILPKAQSVLWLLPVVIAKSHGHHCPPPSTRSGSPGNFLQRCHSVHTGLQVGPWGGVHIVNMLVLHIPVLTTTETTAHH